MRKVEQELVGAKELVPWRQLTMDISFWGLILFIIGTLFWFISNYLRAFTMVEEQRWLQYTTVLTWTLGGLGFFRIDLQGFRNEANRASMTYQKVLADARGKADIVLGKVPKPSLQRRVSKDDIGLGKVQLPPLQRQATATV
jgi:hypothetical protein